MKQVNIIISGRVQGVYFRISTQKQANKFGIFGWVRNTQDGHVEILAQGKKKTLLQFINWCYIGSPASKVDSVYVQWSRIKEKYNSFEVIRSEKGLVSDQVSAYKNFAKNIFGLRKKFRYKNKEYKENVGNNDLHKLSKSLSQSQQSLCNKSFEIQNLKNIPQHVVIIPDGNRRWAKGKGWQIWKGHDAGRKNMEQVLNALREVGVRYATLWAFSTENWKRSEEEVNYLLKIFDKFLDELLEKAHKDKICCVHFGRKDRLPENIVKKLKKLEEETQKYTDFHIGLAIDYGGRDEILRAVNRVVSRELSVICDKSSSVNDINKNGKNLTLITEENFSNQLDTKDFPDPDLIVRTSGEHRLSGLMPWQGVYAEIAFVEKYFPELTQEDIFEIIADYSQRKRRYGK